jgi:hypothetical protein
MESQSGGYSRLFKTIGTPTARHVFATVQLRETISLSFRPLDASDQLDNIHKVLPCSMVTSAQVAFDLPFQSADFTFIEWRG